MSKVAKILKALEFASIKHADDRRKDAKKTPYINHPITVAGIITSVGKIDDADVISAALLHDTIEDTDATPKEIESVFGKRICRYVEEVTDDKELPKQKRKELQIVHAKTLSKGAAIIKIADKIANVTDIMINPPLNWDRKRKKDYFDWAQQVVASCPKVNRLLENHFSELIVDAKKSLQ